MSYFSDHYDPDPFEDHGEDGEDFTKTCKYCGASGLEWVELKEGWRLINSDGDVHSCARPKPNPADDFGPPPKKAPPPWRYSERTGKPICKCGRGYASRRDGFCIRCRGKQAKL